jgi:hypothetical protein
MDYAKIIQILSTLITIVGDVKLSEAKTWAETKANAEELRSEGHTDFASDSTEALMQGSDTDESA